jgi:hypothetical protein
MLSAPPGRTVECRTVYREMIDQVGGDGQDVRGSIDGFRAIGPGGEGDQPSAAEERHADG